MKFTPSVILLASSAIATPIFAQQSQDTIVTTTVTTTTTKAATPEERAAAAVNSRTHVPLIIPAGTPVKVKLERDVSSASVNPGDTVTFRMAADYSEYGHVLISEDTRVHGIVSSVERRSAGGKPGTVTLQVESVRAVDGQRIPLNGAKMAVGKGRQTQAATLGILTLGLGATKKGLSAVIASGTQFTVYTAKKATIVVPR